MQSKEFRDPLKQILSELLPAPSGTPDVPAGEQGAGEPEEPADTGRRLPGISRRAAARDKYFFPRAGPRSIRPGSRKGM